MRKIFVAVVFSLTLAVLAVGQTPASAQKKVDNEFVHEQFGDQFTYLPEFGWAVGDLDGDGVEDIIIAARCKNPMIDQAERNFRVVDPLNSFYGYGDPRLTTTFAEGDPSLRGMTVLIIHGDGPEAWRSAKPKAKYVIVNLPFKAISVRKMQLTKKRMIEAIYVEEAGELGECSAVFFDGKKLNYMYVPMGGNMH